MMRARHKAWHGAAPFALGFSLLALVAAAEGCGSSSTPDTSTSTTSSSMGGMSTSSSSTGKTTSTGGNTTSSSSPTSSTGSPTSSSSSMGGSGGMGGAGTLTIAQAANGDFTDAFDSAPDAKGDNIYFTATDMSSGAPGVYKVSAKGGASSAVASGAPLEAPFGVAISGDDKTLFIADISAEPGGNTAKGGIFTVAVAGGTPALLAGTDGTRPRGVEISNQGGKDVLYFTGTDKTNGAPGVFSIPAAGGTVTTIAEGAPFNDPVGVAVAANGDVYVTDSASAGSHLGEVYVIKKGGSPALLASDLHLGEPAGIALHDSDKTALVSGVDAANHSDVLLEIDTSSATVTVVGGMIGNIDLTKNFEAAGMHRAKSAEVFAWADARANNGVVYTVSF